jgi:hypothetical protein
MPFIDTADGTRADLTPRAEHDKDLVARRRITRA